MLDIAMIRTHPDLVRQGLARKGEPPTSVDNILAIDERRRAMTTERDELRTRRNAISKEVGRIKSQGASADQQMAESRRIGEAIKDLETHLATVEEELSAAALMVPNLPADDVPDGKSPEDNVVVKTVGDLPKLDFAPQAHWDLGARLGVLDLERGAKISGSGFCLFVGQGSRLVRALLNWMLDVHTGQHGYTEVWPPALVSARSMTGTGQLPKFEQEMYRLRDDPYYLIPTAEVPVTNMYQDEILSEADLPILRTAYTPCFRREAGAAGRETRGMIRVHQFDKVELVKFTTPQSSPDEHEKLTRNAETLLERLGLPYRRVLLCAGDMSFSSNKCWDLEVYAAGCGRWLEVSSCSNFGDFQARRANIRYRDSGGKVRFVHTLNGSGLALPRVFIAILENFQQADGAVRIPEVLRPYMGGKEFLGK